MQNKNLKHRSCKSGFRSRSRLKTGRLRNPAANVHEHTSEQKKLYFLKKRHVVPQRQNVSQKRLARKHNLTIFSTIVFKVHFG